MKIAHICLCGPFTEGMTYQENLLPIQNAIDGNDVLIVASCYAWEKNKLVKLAECNKTIESGVRLIRIDYDKVFCKFFTEKIRKSSKLIPIIKEFAPDIVFHHDIQVYELINLARYKRRHQDKKLIVDCHSDFYNSARNVLSYIILHKIFYKMILWLSKNDIDMIYCISRGSERFLREVYNYHGKNVQIFPLGGVMIERNEVDIVSKRQMLGIECGDIVLVHTGKIDRRKKTKELIEIINKKGYNNIKLIIIGSIEEEYRRVVEPLIKGDPNIIYIGWKNGNELLEYLAIADIYVQPGSASATLQNAICAGDAIIAANNEIYRDLVKKNGWLIDRVEEIADILDLVEHNPTVIENMKRESKRIGGQLLDYKVLANRMYKV